MKKTTLQKGIIQGLIFNIIIFILFLSVGMKYFLPQYNLIEDKKRELSKLKADNDYLLTKGLSFTGFKDAYSNDHNIKDYLKNIFADPSKDLKNTYIGNLINTGSGNLTYEEFIKEKTKKIKDKELSIKDSQIKAKIEKILPFYKSDSSLEEKGMTDFEFINYMEKIIHTFGLKYTGNLGIGNLSLEDSSSNYEKTKNKNQIDGEIYSFNLSLQIEGPKKNIIDFIYYLENVGSIDFTNNGEDIKIKRATKNKNIIDENGNTVKNDFYNLSSSYFQGNEDIFNNLIVDIESIKMGDYIDSSADPISYDKGETFIDFIKKDQTNEKYKVDLVLKFYVKGLEKFKTKEYISKVVLEYNKLKKVVSTGIKFGKANGAKLSNKSLLSLKELEKTNSYLKFISKDIKNLSNPKKLQSELGNVYKDSQKYQNIFNNISNSFDAHLKNVSKKIYDQYIESLNKEKNKKND